MQAQTLKTIRTADRIIFVGSDGNIKEQGSWDELVAIEDGGFAKFVKLQGLEGHTLARPPGGKKTEAAAASKGAVIFTEWALPLIPLGGQAPHVLVRPMGCTRGEPNDIELAAAHTLFYRSFPGRQHQGRR